jgi:hypothetical protein
VYQDGDVEVLTYDETKVALIWLLTPTRKEKIESTYLRARCRYITLYH